MKKKVKSLIIAASVAAIAGIGAVSFAAWQGGAVTDKTASGTTGNIATASGELTVTQNLSDTVKLVPYDQVVQFDSTTMAKMQTITLTYGGEGAPAVAGMDISMKLTANSITTAATKLYYKLGDVSDVPTDTTGWTEFTLNTAVELSSAASQKINVIMDSSNTADMNATYTITFSAAEKTA